MTLSPIASLGKRDITLSSEKIKNKKRKFDDLEVSIKVNYDHSSINDNCVYIGESNYNKLTSNHEEKYLKVAHYVYQVKPKRDEEEEYLEINQFQKVNLKTFISMESRINIKEFCPEENGRHAIIKRMILQLKPYSSSGLYDKRIIKIDINHLENYIKEQFSKQFFENEQTFFIDYEKCQFEARVKKQFFIEKDEEKAKVINIWGRIHQASKIAFKCSEKNILLTQKNLSDIEKYYFKISEINQASQKIIKPLNTKNTIEDSWKEQLTPLPLCITFPKLVKEIKNTFKGEICVGDEKIIRLTTFWKVKILLLKITLKDNINVPIKNKKYTSSFTFLENIPIEVSSASNVIFTVDEENAMIASQMEFKIINIDPIVSYDNPNDKFWIDVTNLLEQLKTSYISLPLKGRMTVQINGKIVLLELIDCIKSKESPINIKNDLKDIWAIDSNTKIKFSKRDNLHVKLVDTSSIYLLKKLNVKIERITLGLKNEDKPITINIKTMKEKFFKSLPQYLFKNQKLECIIDSKNAVILYIENFHLDLQKIAFEYGALFQCDENTEINFIIKENTKSNIVLIKDELVGEINFERKLFELGVGGLPEEVIAFIKDIYYSQNQYKELYKRLDQIPERNALFYGPPGTGKTLLAKNIGEILGICKSNTKILNGSDLLVKYVGDTEKKIRELFENAVKDQEKYGNESPLHLLIIDEIDSLFKKRTETSRSWETSTVNAFLGELDGIRERLNNTIVIGITNFKESLDEALLRSGRLGIHLHIGLPNSQGRKEIFQIHIKKMMEEKIISENLDTIIESLVAITTGKSGAFIKSFVKKAFASFLQRYSKLKSEGSSEILCQIEKCDFNQAYHSLTQKSEAAIQDYFNKPHYEISEIKNKLKECGIVGVSKETIECLEDIVRTRILFYEELRKINYQFLKGLCISGPQGVGKTQLAKSFKKVFNLREEQYFYYHISLLWQKNDQYLKDEIKKIFMPIFEASKDLKDQAPLNVVVIDGIGELFAHSQYKNSHPSLLIDKFYCEIENLNNGSFPENLFIVYTSSYNRNVGADYLKFSPRGEFIKLNLPTYNERKEILEYYLEPLIQEKIIEKDINYEKLILLTEQQTGAFIQAFISLAQKKSLKKLTMIHEYKISMMDLIEAIDELKNEDEWKKHIFI